MDREQRDSNSRPPGYSASGPYPRLKRELPQPLQRRWEESFLIFVAYTPLMAIPWVALCVIDWRTSIDSPLGVGMSDLDTWRNLMDAIPVISMVAAVLSVPMVSALLARAAVHFAQRRKEKLQALSVRQLFALADRRWARLWPLIDDEADRSSFVTCGFILIILAAIQQPLQMLLVKAETRNVLVCEEKDYGPGVRWVPTCLSYRDRSDPIGTEPEPGAAANLSDVEEAVYAKSLNVNGSSPNTHLWQDPYPDPYYRYRTTSFAEMYAKVGSDFFVSTVPTNKTTGLIRQHTLRLNSTAECQQISRQMFPVSCAGENPFMANFSRAGLNIRICSQGNSRIYPWTESRDRQDITEEFFIDSFSTRLFSPDNLSSDRIRDSQTNYTLRCTGKTTRGYFELGNIYNGYQRGGLLEKWPTESEMSRFQDFLPGGGDLRMDGRNEAREGSKQLREGVPGPLAVAVRVLFGPESFFNAARLVLEDPKFAERFGNYYECDYPQMPLGGLGLHVSETYETLFETGGRLCSILKIPDPELFVLARIHNMVRPFTYPNVATEALEATMYFANELSLVDEDGWKNKKRRQLWNIEGRPIVVPKKSLAVTVVLSILICLQFFSLVYLLWHAAWNPRWTETLDSIAVATIGAELRDKLRLPPMGTARSYKVEKMLQKVDGLIGIAGGPTRTDVPALETEMIDMSHHHTGAPPSRDDLDIDMTRPTRAPPATTTTAHEESTFPSFLHLETPPPEPAENGSTHPPVSSSVLATDGEVATGSRRNSLTPSYTAASARAPSPPPPYLGRSAAESSGVELLVRHGYDLALGGPGVIARATYREARKLVEEARKDRVQREVQERRDLHVAQAISRNFV